MDLRGRRGPCDAGGGRPLAGHPGSSCRGDHHPRGGAGHTLCGLLPRARGEPSPSANTRARSSSSTSGQPGARPAARKCRPSLASNQHGLPRESSSSGSQARRHNGSSPSRSRWASPIPCGSGGKRLPSCPADWEMGPECFLTPSSSTDRETSWSREWALTQMVRWKNASRKSRRNSCDLLRSSRFSAEMWGGTRVSGRPQDFGSRPLHAPPTHACGSDCSFADSWTSCRLFRQTPRSCPRSLWQKATKVLASSSIQPHLHIQA